MAVRKNPIPPPNSMLLDFNAAAADVHLSRSTFRRRFVDTKLVQLIDVGARSPSIMRSQLRAAVLKIAREQKADPSLVKPRSGGAVLKARGVVGNPFGRAGKPALEVKAPKAKAARK